MNILLTGATGFVGKRLAEVIDRQGCFELTCIARKTGSVKYGHEVLVSCLDAKVDWSSILVNQQVVIQGAARAHIMKDEVPDPLMEYRRVNVDGTLNLARQAARAGTKRFIYISSIKVNGELTPFSKPFTADDMPAPEDPYGITKLEAERGLLEIAEKTGMEVVIIRPPLVYGPGVKANFGSMMRWLDKGVPLPLGAIHNRRSLVALDNLVDLINTCIHHPAAANQVFLAGDGEDLSTSELLRRMGQALGKPARLVPIPTKLLELAARLAGKQAIAQRLCGSLRVDISKTQQLLGWRPPVSVDQALNETAQAYLNSQNPS